MGGEIKTHKFKEFMASNNNKSKLQDVICCSWEKPEAKQSISTTLYLSGGFLDEKESTCITPAGITNVSNIVSCQTECDTSIVLHAIYSVQ